MSTSPSLARDPNAEVPNADASSPNFTKVGLQPFPYDTIAEGAPRARGIYRNLPSDASPDANSQNTAATRARESQAREQGRLEARADARRQYEEQLAKERASLAAALTQFTRDRSAYFEKIEGEVVALALSIARKVLHREAQLDPLLLAGIVRVALEGIDGATGVRLRVHPQNGADWRRYLSLHLEPADLPEIVEDPAQPIDGCVLETAMGTAALGLNTQLKEIENGLMDLLAARPGASE